VDYSDISLDIFPATSYNVLGMKKALFTLAIISSFIFLFVGSVYASTISRKLSKLDESLSDQTLIKYGQPSKILITRVTTKSDELKRDSQKWFRALYYYSITRLGYADIPFTYIVDREGSVYEGKKGGIGVVPELKDDEGAVSIGYLSNSSDITQGAADAIKKKVGEVSYMYGIEKEAVHSVNFSLTKNDSGVAKSVYKESDSLFSDELDKIITQVTFYDKEHIEYDAGIAGLKYEKSFRAGEKNKVSFVLENKNDFAWFTDVSPVYVSTKDGKDSQFAINGVWDSFSKPVSISDKTIQPGEKVTVEFELQALLLPGKHAIEFVVMKLPDNLFEGSELKLDFDVTKGNFKLAQVTGTPGGVLNVRTCPSGNCESVSQVNEGQVFIFTEKSVGWYKIQYTEDKTGWVYGPYIIEL